MRTDTLDNDIVFYTPKDIQGIFGCSKNRSYELMHSDGFPAIQINRKLIVSKDKLLKWIDKNSGRSYKI